MTDTSRIDLHDRLSRGETLTPDDQQTLEAWYAQQDSAEHALINNAPPSDTIVQLQQQITQTAIQLQAITQQISATIAINETIRNEISALYARLAQQSSGRAA